MFKELYRKLIFFFGDIRRLHAFPYITWSVHKHRVDYDPMRYLD